MKVTFTDTSANQYDSNADIVKYTSDKALGKLYIGDRDSGSFLQLKSRKCTVVVNCAADMHGLSQEKEVKYLNIDPEIKNSYEEAFVFIDKALLRGKNVTVQCQNGLGKSAAIILHYLMKKTPSSLADSHRLLKKSRKDHVLNIKPELTISLMVEEKKLRKFNSISLDGRKIRYLDEGFSGLGKKKSGKNGFPYIPLFVFIGFIATLYGGLLLLTGKA